MQDKSFIKRYRFCIALVLAVFAVLVFRLVDFQIINGQTNYEKANRNNIVVTKTEPLRGEIVDINGLPLAQNQVGYQIVFDRFLMDDSKENNLIIELIKLLKAKKEPFVDELPIVVNKGKFEFAPGKEKEVELMRSKKRLNVADYTTAEECIKIICERYNLPQLDKELTRDLCSVKYNMLVTGYFQLRTTSYTFAQGISDHTVMIISEKYQDEKAIRINQFSTRALVEPELAPHIVGMTGKMDEKSYEQLKSLGYGIEDVVGKSGFERTMEKELRGVSGERKVTLDRTGKVLDVLSSKNAEPGKTVFLTIDSKIQNVANKALESAVKAARGEAPDCKAGAVVALRVKDFSVVASATYPSFNMEQYAKDPDYYKKITEDPTLPLYNRALQGGYPPGSTFKPLVGLALLEENLGTVDDKVHCSGLYVYPGAGAYTTKCLGHHGSANFFYAMARSCNVYFSEMSRRAKIENLVKYCKMVGLGEKTGTELPEIKGTIAGPENCARLGLKWDNKATIKSGIGQAENLFSPVQLATYTATIANNGIRNKVHFVRKITDYRRENTVFENNPDNPQVLQGQGISFKTIDSVKKAMRGVVTGGTATILSGCPVTVAAKTGTSQVESGTDTVLCIAFAPYEKPEIAVACVIEHGRRSTHPKNVLKAIIDAYFTAG